ncbi:hypothetical protein C8Q74DRAFT_151584 [Fomes fomentarius]|nr:hypothetical protein C8Q74DRAFT_151584 [Fomes fomentarius]
MPSSSTLSLAVTIVVGAPQPHFQPPIPKFMEEEFHSMWCGLPGWSVRQPPRLSSHPASSSDHGHRARGLYPRTYVHTPAGRTYNRALLSALRKFPRFS